MTAATKYYQSVLTTTYKIIVTIHDIIDIDGVYFNAECVRILRKEDFYFNENTTLILRSLGKFQVFGENYERLSPYDTKDKENIYLFENMQDYRRIFVINSRRFTIHIIVQPVIRSGT